MTTQRKTAPILWFSLGLSFVAGLVDVTTFVTLNGLFSAHVTGNIAVLAADLVHGVTVGLLTALAVPIFVVVTFVITVLHQRVGENHSKHIAYLSWLQAILIVIAGVFALLGDGHGPTIGVIACGTAAIVAMAVQNAMLHLEFRPVPSTAVMTGNIVAASIALGVLAAGKGDARGQARASWRIYWPLIVGFCLGAVIAAAAASLPGHWVWLICTLTSATVAIAAQSRSHAGSTTPEPQPTAPTP
jgi:uncharacterized membrane protein YoaK (UPF0700 family)